MIPTPVTLLLFTQPAPVALWEVPYDQLIEREDLGLMYRQCDRMCEYHLKVKSCVHYSPFRDIPEGKILPVGRT